MPSGVQGYGFAQAQDHEERAEEKRAEAEQLLAAHYHRRRGTVARGYVVSNRKTPRGLHHALSARHPETRRKLLYPAALVLLDVLHEDAGPPADSSGARRVFGKTQGYYAKRLGLSMQRGKNGEVNGARFIRTLLAQLVGLGLIKKGGRCYFEKRDERYPRLVVWLQPWNDSLATRYADALGTLAPTESNEQPAPLPSESLRIPGSGCISPLLDQSSVDGLGGVGGKEEKDAPSARSFEIPERPSAAAFQEGEGIRTARAELAPLVAVETLGSAALRVLRGSALALVIQHIAKTRPSPISTEEGRGGDQYTRPISKRAQARRLPPRPHSVQECPGGAGGCVRCHEWAAAVVAAPSATPATIPTWRPSKTAAATPLGSVVSSLFGRGQLTIEAAAEIAVWWTRCDEADFPYRAVVGGRRWKLQRGRDRTLTLVVDGDVIGPVTEWPASWRR